EVLRRGVSDIFVTMARRNRSLVDRQLALLDELEAEVDDPGVLSNYYQLDHLATRMRRNSESLLVLANAETRRRRTRATEIDDVVRAAIGEVEDYRRVDVMHLDSLQVRGSAVADLSHLLAELIDNATSFSPPDSRVRVAGGFHDDGYLITIADEGVGITHERMLDLNALLASPPIVGLSVEPTLGMSVVSLLANKHNVSVALAASSPGVTVEVMLPADLYGPIDAQPVAAAPASDDEVVVAAAAAAAAIPADRLVEWADEREVEGFVPVEPLVAEQPSKAALPTDVLLHAADVTPTGPVVDPASPAAPRLRLSGEADPAPATPAPATPALPPQPVVNDAGLPMRRAAAETPAIDSPALPTRKHAEPIPTFDLSNDADEIDLASLTVEPSWARNGHTNGDGDHEDDDLSSLGRETSREPESVQPSLDAVAEAPPAPDALFLPPAPGARVAGEFDRPPAPPAFGTTPVARPVADPNARPVPQRKPEDPPASPTWDRGGALPTRSRGNAPDGGVDRLSDTPMVVPAVPSSLQAALTAFDAGRNGRAPSLQTRNPGAAGNGDHGGDDRDGQPASIAPSKLDADAIRERLRAFQTEYKFGRHDGADDEDHGGDR
ncbi:MAG TPA: ATP-binding protein, partial [Ilumatobacteraceae bacterium]